MLSEGTSERVGISSGSEAEESSGEEVPSKLSERSMVDGFR